MIQTGCMESLREMHILIVNDDKTFCQPWQRALA
jgi:ActR/RegA family two-component response regulator